MTTRIVTPPFLLSYANLLEANEDLSGNMKFSASMIFDKDATDLKQIEKCIKDAKEAKFGKKKIKGFKSPLRDGDIDRDDREEYENSWFMNASSKRRAGVIDYKTGDVVDTDDEDIGVYSGCICRASITFFGYDQKGNKGVGVGLNSVQVLKRGERLDGSVSAERAFEDAEDVNLEEL